MHTPEEICRTSDDRREPGHATRATPRFCGVTTGEKPSRPARNRAAPRETTATRISHRPLAPRRGANTWTGERPYAATTMLEFPRKFSRKSPTIARETSGEVRLIVQKYSTTVLSVRLHIQNSWRTTDWSGGRTGSSTSKNRSEIGSEPAKIPRRVYISPEINHNRPSRGTSHGIRKGGKAPRKGLYDFNCDTDQQ